MDGMEGKKEKKLTISKEISSTAKKKRNSHDCFREGKREAHHSEKKRQEDSLTVPSAATGIDRRGFSDGFNP